MGKQQQYENYPEPVSAANDQQTPDEFLEKFLEELEQVRELFDWELVQAPGNDPDDRSVPRFRLRGVSKAGTALGETFEPIGALCYIRTGSAFTEDNWSEAARTLGLPSLCVAEIIAAANDHTWSGPGGDREPVEHLQALRQRLIRAVGLRIRQSRVERVVDHLIPRALQAKPVR